MTAVTLLDPALLPSILGAEAVYFNVDSIEEIDSTNDELSRRVTSEGLPSGSVLVAGRQTAGKGRQGRVWTSDPKASLTFSLYWRFAVQPQQMAGLSLAVGLALYRALDSLGASDIALKWPNDVLCRSHNRHGDWAKLAGILIELSPGKKGVDAIIGIGLNLFPIQVPVAPSGTVGMLPGALSDVMLLPPERHEVLAAILRYIRPVFQAFKASGLATLKTEWEKAHAWQGKQVAVQGNTAEMISGTCVGIADDGALLIDTPEGRECVFAGDVSLRQDFQSASKILCLDAGNTRLKWGISLLNESGDFWLDTGVCSYDDLASLGELLGKQKASVTLAGISNVAGVVVGVAIAEMLASKLIPIQRAASSSSALGVANGYAAPETLGTDRWCALVAAWQRDASACLVVSLGTATTIDALDDKGRFCGGMILPGVTLMRRSLAEGTAQLPKVEGAYLQECVWPTSTDEAIFVGSLEATAGAIERAWHRLSQQLYKQTDLTQTGAKNSSLRCLITGGAAPSLVPYLGLDVEVCEHLVLEGVRYLSCSSD
ncbi:MAG: hypothetical protein RIR18_722 [Pseudomonadota bacterium]|jgi:BirA family biotin operon repressor/biotin-[acetyl-CoA-carboxylase] ligase